MKIDSLKEVLQLTLWLCGSRNDAGDVDGQM
jgi:hypothetical protein